MAHDTSVAATPDGVTGTPDPKRWLALAVVLVAGFMDLLDATIVNVAIPSLQEDLKAQYADLEWIVAAYAISFAAVLITGGRLGDIFGRKRLFLVGVVGFTLASTLCGVAPTALVLILARFLQGATAALMVPQILAIIHVTFPQSERGKVFGMFGGIVGSASVAGPIVGGLLVQGNILGLEWRPIFLVNIPVGIFAVVAGRRFIRESTSPSAPRLDLVGMVIAIAAILLLVYPLTEGRTLGWPAWTYAMIAVSLVLFAVFVAYERRRAATVGSPLVVLGLFRARSFVAGLGVWLLFNIALGGFFLVWTLYMQIGLGWSPLRAGLTSVSFAFGAAPAAGLSIQVLTPRFGRKVLMAGALLNAVGFGGYIWHVTHYGSGITSWLMVVPLVVAGAGFGLVVAPVIDLVLSSVPREDAGSASGLFNTTQQLGAALGVAVIGMIFFSVIAGHADDAVRDESFTLRAQLTAAHVPASAQDAVVAGFARCTEDRSAASDPTATPASCRRQSSGDATSTAVARVLDRAGAKVNAENFAHSFAVALGIGIGILLVVLAGMFALPRKARQLEDGEMAAVA